MSFLRRLVLRILLPPALWAYGTPFEPMLTWRKRAEPITGGDIDLDMLRSLESYIDAYSYTLARLLVCGLAILVVGLLPFWSWYLVLDEPFATLSLIGACGIYLMHIVWVGWVIVFVIRQTREPLSDLDDRLILSLKLGVAPSEVVDMIHSLPADSAYKLYLGPLIGKTPPRIEEGG